MEDHSGTKAEERYGGVLGGSFVGGGDGDGEGSSYECNICLELAKQEPVVTLCGHLFCCACIYRWLCLHSRSLHQCPVCKAHLVKLIPLDSTRQQSSSSSSSSSSLQHHYHDYPCNPRQSISTAGRPMSMMQEEDRSGQFTTVTNISAASGLFSLLLLGFHDYTAPATSNSSRGVNGRARGWNREEEATTAADEEEAFVRSLLGFLACFVLVCLLSF